MFVRFIQVAAFSSGSFIYIPLNKYSKIYLYILLNIFLGCLHFEAIMNRTVIKILIFLFGCILV